MVAITVSKALGDFELVIKSFQFAGRYRIDGVSNQAIYLLFFYLCKPDESRDVTFLDTYHLKGTCLP